MARRTKQQKQKEKKIALALAAVVAVLVLTAAMVASPAFANGLYRALGILPDVAPPDTGVSSPVAVHVIDVGQGDAVLLEDNGAFALIDAGPPEAADYLLAYLAGAGVQKLEYVFMTHPHADHIGGMQAVVENVQVGLVVLPDFSLAPYPTTVTFEKLLQAMVARDIPAETAKLAATYPLGQGVVQVVHAGLATDDNYNLLSLGLLYQGGGLRVLNTGDGEKQNEQALLAAGLDITADVLLAGHHGSSTSNTDAFMQAVAPRAVVVSCAAGNSYGHPHAAALKAFEAAGARIFRTDKDGSVVIRPDGAGGIAAGLEKNRL